MVASLLILAHTRPASTRTRISLPRSATDIFPTLLRERPMVIIEWPDLGVTWDRCMAKREDVLYMCRRYDDLPKDHQRVSITVGTRGIHLLGESVEYLMLLTPSVLSLLLHTMTLLSQIELRSSHRQNTNLDALSTRGCCSPTWRAQLIHIQANEAELVQAPKTCAGKSGSKRRDRRQLLIAVAGPPPSAPRSFGRLP